MNEVFFSVIIPTFNRVELLKRAVNSVLTQSFHHFELIIIDDGSNDRTQEYLKTITDKRVRHFYQENKGVSAARNFGSRYSKGLWLAFLDSDDEWLVEKLNLQYEYIQNNPNYKLVHGEEIWIRNNIRVNPKKIHKKSGGDQFKRSLELCIISPSATIIKKDFFLELGSFDEDFIVCEDYELWLRVTSICNVGFINVPIIKKYGGHHDQLSHKFFGMDLYRIMAMIKLLNSKSLSSEQITMVLQELKIKTNILKNGYQKRNNQRALNDLMDLLGEYVNI